jgi:type II secretory pathway component GspD/PulD (secretin)
MTACGNMPVPEEIDMELGKAVQDQTNLFESNEKAITKVKTKPLVVSKPKDFPDRIKNKKIDLKLERGSTLEDLAGVFEIYGLNLVIATNNQQASAGQGEGQSQQQSTSDSLSGDELLFVRKFQGTLDDYLILLSELYDISFDYKGNQIVVMQKYSDYIINLPQFPEGDDATITDDILDTVESLGAQNVKHSLISGMVNYKATPFAQKKIHNYLKKMTKSVSVISLQTAIVTVKLDKENSKGFDWSKMQLNMAKDIPGILEAPTTMISETVFNALGSNLADAEMGGQIGKESLSFSIAKSDFSFQSVINFLNTYGKTETNQSVLMRTLSGKKVILKSGEEVPYVSDVSSNATGDNVSSGVDTDIITTGINLEILPYFDNDNEIVTASVKLTIDSILGFVELSAGNQIGNLTQPNVQNQEFESVIRLAAGDTTVIGGIMFDSVEDKRTGNAYLGDSNVSAKNIKMEKSAVFILLRPTVKIFSEEF